MPSQPDYKELMRSALLELREYKARVRSLEQERNEPIAIIGQGCVLPGALTPAALWAAVSDIHVLTGLIAVLMTAVVVAGLVYRPRGRPGRFWTFESVLLIGLFVAASLLVFNLS